MTGPVLQVEGLVKHFDVKRSWLGKPLATVKAVDGVSFSLAAGEILDFCGNRCALLGALLGGFR